MLPNIVRLATFGIALVFQAFLVQAQTPVNFKIAFIADQGLEPESQAVLNLIKDEGALAVLHAGDFDYEKDPEAWEEQINAILGENFPYFACMGEDDEKRYFTIDGYQDRLESRMNRLGIVWDGDLGVQSSFYYNGVFFIQTAPAVEDGEHAEYIRDKLAVDNSFWRISTFHKNMKRMQVCSGGNSTGWDVYEESRKGGAFTTNGQCHVYARTHLMSSMSDQIIASTSDTLVLTKDRPETLEDEGRSFHALSGMGGRSIHRQEREGDWWASIYTKDQDATYGALFGIFNYNGDPSHAYFYFKNIEGAVIDSFYVHSQVKSGYLVRAQTNGLGSVDLNPAGGVYEKDDVVTVTATPAPDWTFAGWSGDLTGMGNPDSITLDTDKTVIANFTSPDFTLTVNVDGSGTVAQNPPGTLHIWGTEVTLRAIADPGHMFGGWSGDVSGNDNPLSIVIDSDKSVTAKFLPNNPPVVMSDSFAVEEDSALSIAAPGVLTNDSDSDGDTLVVSTLSGPSNGSLSLSGDGSFSFIPAADFNGEDSFVYSVRDGRGANVPGDVTITIIPVNDPPVTQADSYTVLEDDTLAVMPPGLMTNDHDVDGDSLSVYIAVPPDSGSLMLNERGAFTYTPNSDFHGVDSFSYSVSDGMGATATDSVTIAVVGVNDAPVAQSDSFSMNEDESLTIAGPGVLANDSDVDGDPLTAALVRDPLHGALNFYEDGSLTYLPNATFNGSDSFVYIVTDGAGGADTALVSLSIQAVNDPPIAMDDDYAVVEDGSLDIAAPGVLSNDSDIDGDSLSTSVSREPSHGTLSLDAIGAFRYAPDADFNGVDRFNYILSDGVGGLDTAAVTITIRAVNDPPVAVDDVYQIDEDSALSIEAPGVMSNDVNVDGDSLSVSVAREPDHGTLTLERKGSFRYVPDRDFNGIDSFEYTLSDGGQDISTATASISVRPMNDAPVAKVDSYSVNEDDSLYVASPGVLRNDADIDRDSLSVAVTTTPIHGQLDLKSDGSFRYKPNQDFNGDDSFAYTLSDGRGGQDTAGVTLSVHSVNDPPAVEADIYQTEEDDTLSIAVPGVLANDHDVDGDTLTVSLAREPTNGELALDENGSFRYRPYQDFYGTDGFEYAVTDGNGTLTTGRVLLIVQAANDPPKAEGDRYTTLEDSTLIVGRPGVLDNDHDLDGDSLTVTVLAKPLHGSLVMAPSGAFTYRPNGEFNGSDTFTYSARDARGGTATARVNITVQPVNDPPVAQEDLYRLKPGSTLRLSPPGILHNDVDVDGDTLTATLVHPPLAGELSLNSDGSFIYVPQDNKSRNEDAQDVLRSFSYMIHDEKGVGSNVAQVIVAITNDEGRDGSANAVPIAKDDVATTRSGQSVAISVTANDTDNDGSLNLSSLVLASLPLNGTAIIDGTPGVVNYAPRDMFEGTDTFSYTVEDDQGARSNVATVTVTVEKGSDMKTLTLPPRDDSHVKYSKPGNNYGRRVGARVQADEFATYLKFQVDGVEDSLYSATLKLFVVAGAIDGGTIYSVSNNYSGRNEPWDEETVTASNAPVIIGKPIAQLGLAAQDSVVEANVSSAISGAGQYSFAISTSSAGTVEYDTKEGDHPPELVIKTGNGAGTVITDIKDRSDDDPTGDEEEDLPKTVVLSSSYPNPFNAETTIPFALPEVAKVELVIYNIKGQEVRKLVDGVQQPGHKKIRWDGKDARGQDVTSGIYFVRLTIGNRNLSSKLILQK